jgi:pimeloyl-ACP methyl ester carboxylesterase
VRFDLVEAAGGVRLRTAAVGDPAAPVVLFGHGVGSSSRFVLDAFGGPLVSAGWQVVAHDLRGHGGSTLCAAPLDYSIDALAGDLHALTEAVAPRVMAGVSLSGHVAVRYAESCGQALDAVVVCLPAWSGRSIAGIGPHAAIADVVDHIGVDGMVASFREDRAMLPWLREVLIRDWSSHDPASLRAALRSLDGGDAPSPEAVAELPTALALVAWPDDPGHPIEVARRWRDLAPRAELVELTMTAMQDDLTAFGDAVVAALDRLDVRP